MYYNKKKILLQRLKSLKKNDKFPRFYHHKRRSKLSSFFYEFSPQRMRLYFKNKHKRKFYGTRLQNKTRKSYRSKNQSLNANTSFL